MQNAAEAIDYLQALLVLYEEQEDPFVSALIRIIHQRLEVLKVCTS